MELIIIVAGLALIIISYFCVGIILRWLWEWLILFVALPFLLFVGIRFGWVGAITALVGAWASLLANNEWHSSSVYFRVSEKIEKAFYFGDT